MTTLDTLIQPIRCWSRKEVLAGDPVPRLAGVYGWWFREIPPLVPTEGCVTREGLTLLYIGIAPKAPPLNGRPASTRTLRHRIRYHLTGNAEGSTLRLTLGCLLSERLGNLRPSIRNPGLACVCLTYRFDTRMEDTQSSNP